MLPSLLSLGGPSQASDPPLCQTQAGPVLCHGRKGTPQPAPQIVLGKLSPHDREALPLGLSKAP